MEGVHLWLSLVSQGIAHDFVKISGANESDQRATGEAVEVETLRHVATRQGSFMYGFGCDK